MYCVCVYVCMRVYARVSAVYAYVYFDVCVSPCIFMRICAITWAPACTHVYVCVWEKGGRKKKKGVGEYTGGEERRWRGAGDDVRERFQYACERERKRERDR